MMLPIRHNGQQQQHERQRQRQQQQQQTQEMRPHAKRTRRRQRTPEGNRWMNPRTLIALTMVACSLECAPMWQSTITNTHTNARSSLVRAQEDRSSNHHRHNSNDKHRGTRNHEEPKLRKSQDAALPPVRIRRGEPQRQNRNTPTSSKRQTKDGRASMTHHNDPYERSTRNGGKEFLAWCHKALGIVTSPSVQIQTFEYYDYMRAMSEGTDVFCHDDDDEDDEDDNDNYNEEDGQQRDGIENSINNHRNAFHTNSGHGGDGSNHLQGRNLARADTNAMDDETHFFSRFNNRKTQHYRSPCSISVTEYPKTQVRGLAASKPIEAGETIIQIPYKALWSIENVIDHDPVLSNVLGPKIRSQFGWQDDLQYYELPLLAIAVLHHMQLGPHSHFWPYWELLHDEALDLPTLWQAHRLKTDASIGVRRIAKDIQKDIREMYVSVVQVLIDTYPEQFGPLNTPTDDAIIDEDGMMEDDGDDEDEDLDEEGLEEWMFSFERFEWAFTIVNSRHWHLTVPSTQDAATARAEEATQQRNRVLKMAQTDGALVDSSDDAEDKNEGDSATGAGSPNENQGNIMDAPPASVPTDEWVEMHDHDLQTNEQGASSDSKGDDGSITDLQDDNYGYTSHSFLAPVADLINFGPPCTRGIYNAENQSFDIVATCSFVPGQEITFWYSDACQDIIIANYGFAFPTMIPKCFGANDWKGHAQTMSKKNHDLQQELRNMIEELDRMALALESTQQTLDDCTCCDTKTDKPRVNSNSSKQQQQRRMPPPSLFPAQWKPSSLFATPTNLFANDDKHMGISGGSDSDDGRLRNHGTRNVHERDEGNGDYNHEDHSSL